VLGRESGENIDSAIEQDQSRETLAAAD